MIRNTEKIKKTVEQIFEISQDYLTYVKTFGNECATTDRLLETIVALATTLENEHEKSFK